MIATWELPAVVDVRIVADPGESAWEVATALGTILAVLLPAE
jgi:hypothetical protein